MSILSTPPYIPLEEMTDDHAPPHANPVIYSDNSTPQICTPRAEDAPINYFDEEFEARERCWRVQARYVAVAQDEERGGYERENGGRHVCGRYRRDESVTLVWCVGFWVLTCMVIVAVVAAAALMWILVTQ
jgi:hypothetical protein